MVQYKFALSIIIIVPIVLFSGCTGNQDITPALRELPQFQQFLKEHPNAKITITYWSKEEMEKMAPEINQQCDKPITPVAMYKATVSDGDLKVVSWINEENQKVICSITEGEGLQTNTSAPTQTAIPNLTSTMIPTVMPTSTVTTTPQFTPITTTVSMIPVPVADQKNFTSSIGMEFILIPAGEFDMGSPIHDRDRFPMEWPVHHVRISKVFYMGKYEVTQKQWRDIMGNNPSHVIPSFDEGAPGGIQWHEDIMSNNPSHFKGDDLPVEQVSWNDIQEFIKKLNEKEGTDKYRLPSEAEWEYAARAGTNTIYSFGNNASELGDYGWYAGNSNYTTHPVGQKKPNPWGLYDVHGNVWEWVQDKICDYTEVPSDGSACAGMANDTRDLRAERGGHWQRGADRSRSAIRRFDPADGRYPVVGFRLARDV